MNDDEPKSERQIYIENLEAKLQKAGKAGRFIGSEDGSIVTEYLTQQINTLVQSIGGRKYISDHSAYVYDTGQLSMAQKILTMLNKEATVDTGQIKDALKEAKNDDGTSSS